MKLCRTESEGAAQALDSIFSRSALITTQGSWVMSVCFDYRVGFRGYERGFWCFQRLLCCFDFFCLVPHLSSGGDLISWKFFTDGAVARPLKSTRQDDNGSYRLSLWWKTSNRSSCRKFCAPCTAKNREKSPNPAQRVKCN